MSAPGRVSTFSSEEFSEHAAGFDSLCEAEMRRDVVAQAGAVKRVCADQGRAPRGARPGFYQCAY